MKHSLLQLWRAIVGYEVGYVGQGTSQWYYATYLGMYIMLSWRMHPAIAPQITTLLIAEFTIVCLYGHYDIVDKNIAYGYGFLLALAAAETYCFILDWQLALKATAIGVIGQLVAPDSEGKSYIIPYADDKPRQALVTNTIWFAFFCYVTMLLPTDLGTRIIIILGAMLLHPLLDISDGAFMGYIDNIMDTIFAIVEYYEDDDDQEDDQQETTNNNDDAPS